MDMIIQPCDTTNHSKKENFWSIKCIDQPMNVIELLMCRLIEVDDLCYIHAVIEMLPNTTIIQIVMEPF